MLSYLVLVPPKQPDSQCLDGKVIQAQYCGEKLTKFIFGTLWFEVKWKQNERKKTIKEQLPIYCLSDPNDFPCQRKISYNFPLVPKTPSTPSPPYICQFLPFPSVLMTWGADSSNGATELQPGYLQLWLPDLLTDRLIIMIISSCHWSFLHLVSLTLCSL